MSIAVPAAVAPGPFAVLRRRGFALLWVGQLVSTMGTALAELAASILVFRLTNSALAVGLMLMASAAPSLFFGLVAGVYVDRWDRKSILVACDLIRAVLVALIPFLIVHSGPAWLFVMTLAVASVGQFYAPANASVLPDIAPDEELTAANSLLAISEFGSMAVGYAAAGLIAGGLPIEWAFYLDAFSFVFSAICIAFVTIPKLTVEGDTTVATVAKNLKAGVAFVAGKPILRSYMTVLVPAGIAIGLWNSIILPFFSRELGASTFAYGIQEGLGSFGFVLASLLLATRGDRLREGQWVSMSFFGMGIFGMAYAFTSSVPVAILLSFLGGFANAPSVIARQLIIQRNAPREMRGRVASVVLVSRDVLWLVGMGLAGLADLMNLRLLVFVVSAVWVAAAGLSLELPGLGQPAAQWRRSMALLRGAATAPRLSGGRPATLADLQGLLPFLPVLRSLKEADRDTLVTSARVIDAGPGTVVVRRGDTSDAAYFVLAGQVVAGVSLEGEEYRTLSCMTPGDYFGEIAALTGSPRTANVVADEPATLLEVPAATLRQLVVDPAFGKLVSEKMAERLGRTASITELPRTAGIDQKTLRELRTGPPASDQGPAVNQGAAA